jgi:hypothetical protein
LLGVDPSGTFTCFPALRPNETAAAGTFCIYSCYGHPVDEVTCQEDGRWSSDPDHLSCSSTTPQTSTPQPSTTTTASIPTTTTTPQPPEFHAKFLWGFFYLGNSIGASGILVGDFDGNGRTEFVLGSGEGYGGNSKVSVLEFADPGYTVVWQVTLTVTDIALISIDGSIFMAASVGKVIYIYDLKTRELVQSLGRSQEIIRTLNVDVDQDGEKEILVLSSKSEHYCSDDCSFTLSILDSNWNDVSSFEFKTQSFYLGLVFGSFTEAFVPQMALSNGEVYTIVDKLNIELVANFNMDLGRYLFKDDFENDGIDEIICSKGGASAYSAVDLGRIWNSQLDHAVDAMVLFDLNEDGREDLVWGGDQWGDIAALDILTGAEFWRTDNPEHGVTDITVGDFDQDGSREIAWGAGASSSGADYFFVCDVASKEEEWRSLDLDPPFTGFDIHDPAGDGRLQITTMSSGSNSG